MYSKRILPGILIAFVTISIFNSCTRLHHKPALNLKNDARENNDWKTRWRTKMLADPATGKIPDGIRAKELAFAATLPKFIGSQNKNGDFWQCRGPWNVGGRTRAIALDVTNENIILAGASNGGIWRSTDGGTSWTKIPGDVRYYSISCIVQDTRTGKTGIWYAGTGEYLGDIGPIHGDGIFKSVDGGLSFAKLPSTAQNAPQKSLPFDYINNIALDPSASEDVVYAATVLYGSVYKSMDGGGTWNKVKTPTVYSDIAVSKKGVVFLSCGPIAATKGLYRSVDGVTFTNILPKNFPANAATMVIGIDPNNENTVYYFGLAPGSPSKYGLVLWKYRYLSGDGTGAGGAWKDLSANIPQWGGYAGDMDPQFGYNLVVKVKPGDSKTVFLGCTNLARSTDSFSTLNNNSWVGGYPLNFVLDTFSLFWPGHHPDQHNLVFYPSDPNKMLSTHDGGISRTTDNRAKAITWKSLNNGYITTEFYSVAIDHATPGNDELIGGMQDNGTFMTRSSNQEAEWYNSYSGDGWVSAIADGRTDYYLSQQLGWTFRVKLDAKGYPYQYRKIDPDRHRPFDGFSPYQLDPNNQKRMYYLAEDNLWRNDDITQIPLRSININFDTSQVSMGWDTVLSAFNSKMDNAALAVAHMPAERVLIGTTGGRIFCIDSADGPAPKTREISASIFPKAGYINSIALNPLNGDEMIVVFTNYNIKSLFHSIDCGKTWEDISANLEEFPDGTGSGPSCQAAAIMPVGHHFIYLIGTSTGLYATDSLKGSNTVWMQQNPDGIGNAFVTMIDTRTSDGLVAVATYGAGIYTAHINFGYQVTGIDNAHAENRPVINMKCYPNPVTGNKVMNLDFDRSSFANTISYKIINIQGQTIMESGDIPAKGYGRQHIPIMLPELKSGIYYIHIRDGGAEGTRSFLVQE